jgi:hypothetical protein
VTSNVSSGSTTWVMGPRRVRRVSPPGSPSFLTGAGLLDSWNLIVGSDGPLGARAFLFRNAVAGLSCRTPVLKMSGNSPYGARAGTSGTGAIGHRRKGGC